MHAVRGAGLRHSKMSPSSAGGREMVVGTASYFLQEETHVSVTEKGHSLGWPLGWGQVGFFCLVILTSFSQMNMLLIGVQGAVVKRTCSGQYPPMQWTVHNAKHGQVFVEEVKAA